MRRTAPRTAATLLAGLALCLPGRSQVILQQGPPALTSTPANDVVAADLAGDGDGFLDLAVTLGGAAEVQLVDNFFGSGFVPGLSFSLTPGSSPQGIVAGDLDLDGWVDLAVALEGSDEVLFITAWQVGSPVMVSIPLGSAPRELALCDLDLDGDWDLVATCPASGEVCVLRNLGGLGFASTLYPVGAGLGELGVAELSGDDLPDVAVCVGASSRIQILVGTGGGVLAAGPALTIGAAEPRALALGDLDGDADVDLAYTYELNGLESAKFFLNQGGGAFAGTASISVPGQGATSVGLSDLDVDGDLDLVAVSPGTSEVVTWENMGAGLFEFLGTTWPTDPGAVRMALSDFDGSGAVDLLVAGSTGVATLRNIYSAATCSVVTYCTPKTNSLGKDARIRAVGAPAFGSQGFSILMDDGVPGAVGIAFQSEVGPAATPFLGGTFCVQPPTTRFAPRVVSSTGQLGYAVPFGFERVGTTTWYQFWYRDPTLPDGTGAALSDALEVTFCD